MPAYLEARSIPVGELRDRETGEAVREFAVVDVPVPGPRSGVDAESLAAARGARKGVLYCVRPDPFSESFYSVGSRTMILPFMYGCGVQM